MEAMTALRARNLEVFRERFPKIHDVITAITAPLSSCAVENGEVVDIDLGNGRLYKTDGRAFSTEQALNFIDAPRRVGYMLSDAASGDSGVSLRIANTLLDGIQQRGIKVWTGPPVGRAGYLFVFGLGLGYHLPILAEHLDVDQIIVLDTVNEFALHSLSAIDWGALLEKCDSKETEIKLLISDNQDDLLLMLESAIYLHGEVFMDGAYYYRHYPSWALDVVFTNLADNTPLKLASRGYYEDERKMIRNAVSCLQKYDHTMLEGKFGYPIEVPAFLVASGPSLDHDIEYIRKWRDHVVVFSGGSSLQALLAAGIIPDYHVELENVVQVWDFCTHILELNKDLLPEGRFTGIKLIASCTLNPRVPPLFDETYFFFRDSVSSSICFGEEVKLMSGIGPNIANTIVAICARIGFREVYLFGMDCGWRDEDRHHSKDTAYYTNADLKVEKQDSLFTLRGNFGGEIKSTLTLGWCHDMLEEKIKKFNLTAYNCSDGALIRGAAPKLAETIDLTTPVPNRAKIFDSVRSCGIFHKAGEFLATHDMARYEQEVDRFEAAILKEIDESLADGKGFRGFLRRISDFARWGLSSEEYGHVYPVFQGATVGLAKNACVFLNRIENPAEAAELFEVFAKEYRQIHQEMADETRTIFAEARGWVDGGEEPWWAAGLPTTPGTTY